MAGHSKWANIKHRKAASDAVKGKMFSKMAKEIMVAARIGGGDPAANITLRSLVQKARGYNMPADNIDRAIKKGTGELASDAMEEIVYEGFAPGGVSVIVACYSDNRNRTAAEVRNVFNKSGGNLAQNGSVSRSFTRRGQLFVAADQVEEDRLLEVVLEAGAEDAVLDGDAYEILTDPSAYPQILEALEAAGIPVRDSEVTLLPDTYMTITDKDQASQIMKFIGLLEELDDVQNVYSNLDVDDALLDELAG
jgi:YebC/PmpR family DNA-binding regulatory protein